MEIMNESDFLNYLKSQSQVLIEDHLHIRIFKLVDSSRIYYKKHFKESKQEVESILDFQDALILYNLFS